MLVNPRCLAKLLFYPDYKDLGLTLSILIRKIINYINTISSLNFVHIIFVAKLINHSEKSLDLMVIQE